MKKNLVLTGMMGVGKSTIGTFLSKKLKMEFHDVDEIIEKKYSLTIRQIFEKHGEPFFRKIEEEETLFLIEKENGVIALGGGSFMNEKLRKRIKETALSVWLDLNINELLKRTKINHKRPLLDYGKTKESLEKILNERKKIYSMADHKISCDFKSKEEIVDEISKIYESE